MMPPLSKKLLLLLLVMACGGFCVFMLLQINSTGFPYIQLAQDTGKPTPEKNDENEPNIDMSPIPSEATIIEELQRQFPSLPVAYWNAHKNMKMFYKNESCAKYPSIFELKFNNMYWQTLHTTKGMFQLYGAFYDIRRFSKIGPAIRILGFLNRINPVMKPYCQIWFENSTEPVFAKLMEYNLIWNKSWGNYKQEFYQPYLMSCQIPPEHNDKIPTSVSLVEKQCDKATNNLNVIFNKPEEKKDFAVCVKGLSFPYEDLSIRLVEWIELLGILGADKIFFYELEVHPNVSKVLRYYEKLDRVGVTPITLPGDQPNLPGLRHMYLQKNVNFKRQNELIPYNDCFYKNIYTYKYIALLDTDEVIVPINTSSWKDMVESFDVNAQTQTEKARSSYCARNVYFLDDMFQAHGWSEGIPKYMHMLQYVYRAENFTNMIYSKCLHNTEKVLTLHNHYPFSCLGACTNGNIPTSDAKLQHYRSDCVKELSKTCVEYRKNSVMDNTIWKYKDSLITHTTKTLKILGFL